MKKVLIFLSTPDPYMRCRYWLDEGLRLKKLKNYTEAIQCFDEVLKINHQDPEAWYQKGLTLAESDPKKDNEAIICYDQALNFKPQHKDAWYRKGLLLMKLGENGEAVKCFDQALKIEPRSILILHSKGTSLTRLGKYTEATECYDQALKIDPDYKDVLCEKGISLNYLGKNAEAIKCFDKALQVVSSRKKAWQDKGWQGKAYALLNQKLQFDKTETEAWNGKAYALLNQKQFKEAEDCFDKALSKSPHFIYSLQGRGLIAYQNQNFELANQYFQKAEAHVSKEYKTYQLCTLYYHRGKVFAVLNNLKKAKETLERAIALDPNFSPAQKELSKLQESTPEPKVEEAEVEKILAAYHKAEANDNKKLSKLISQDQLQKIKVQLQVSPQNVKDVIEKPALSTDIASQWYEKGQRWQRLNKYTEAIKCFDLALESNPDHKLAWKSKATALEILGEPLEAIRCYNNALKIDPKDIFLLQRKGQILIKIGEYTAALECFNRIFKIKSNISPTHMCDLFYYQGKAFVGLNQLGKAKEAFNKALALDPNYDLAKSELRKLQVMGQKSNTTQPQRLEKLTKESHELDEEFKKLQAEDEEIEKQLKTYRKSTSKPSSQKMEATSSPPKASEKKKIAKPKPLPHPQEDLTQLLQETPQESQQHLEKEIQTLKQQLQTSAQYQITLEQKIQSLQTDSVKTPELANLKKELADLQIQNEEVKAEREIKAAKLAAENRFKAQPNAWLFYRIMCIHLENSFLGAKNIASGFPKLGYTGKIGDVATGINVLSKFLSLIPAIGNSLDTIVSLPTTGLEKIDEERITNILKAVAELGTLTDIKRAAESTARQLTERYSDQLNQLSTENKKPTSNWEKIKEGGKSLYDATKEFVVKEQASSSPKEVAEFAVSQIVSALLDLSIKPDQPLDAQFIQAVCTSPSRLEKIKHAVTGVLGLNEIETKDGKTWQLQNFYRKPGIRTAEGECYAGEGAEPELYGYRLGTREEAVSLQWQLMSTTKEIKQPELVKETPQVLTKIPNSYATVNTQLQQQPLSLAHQDEVAELKQRLKAAEEARIKHENELCALKESQERENMQREKEFRTLHSKMNKLLQEQGDKDVSSDVDIGNQLQVKAQSQQNSQRSTRSGFSSTETNAQILEHDQRLSKLEQITALWIETEEKSESINSKNEEEDSTRSELFSQYSTSKR